ncbi:MAG: XRE family transcriptional regulator [Christensenella sp.]|nr:XRE family transcriptional regulator [Christensenella sp.]
MNNQVIQIAARIRELREILDISREELAKKVGVSIGEYERYENAQDDIPIGVLYGVAAELHVDPTELLTGEAPRMDEYTIVRGGNGVCVERYPGYAFTALAFNYKHRDMEPMIVTISPNDEAELVTHGGQEFNYVLEGSVKVVIQSREFILEAGDSIYFNPKLPHGQRAVGGQAKFLTIINE